MFQTLITLDFLGSVSFLLMVMTFLLSSFVQIRHGWITKIFDNFYSGRLPLPSWMTSLGSDPPRMVLFHAFLKLIFSFKFKISIYFEKFDNFYSGILPLSSWMLSFDSPGSILGSDPPRSRIRGLHAPESHKGKLGVMISRQLMIPIFLDNSIKAKIKDTISISGYRLPFSCCADISLRVEFNHRAARPLALYHGMGYFGCPLAHTGMSWDFLKIHFWFMIELIASAAAAFD